jgi:hypothetical protein
MTAIATLSLFADCPLPGCFNPVDDPREPCGDCLALFGNQLRRSGREVTAEEFTAAMAERDEATRTSYAAQRVVFEATETEPTEPAEPGVEWRSNQTCWLCEDRRKCRHDPSHPDRWICRTCLDA